MALHNFRYKDCDLRLSCSNPRTLIPYVLIVSDEVQGWERERLDIDAVLPHQAKSGGKAKKSTDLIGITFREKRAFIILNHRLKDPSLKKKYEQYLDGRTLLLKKHYPIRALFPQLRKEIREKLIKSVVSLTAGVGASLVPIVGGILTSLIEIKPDTVNDLQVSVQRLKKLQEIANTECTKHLLVPTAPNPIYEICIDHRIDGDPYLTVVFPM